MSIARALSNALTGLSATSRGTETVAANLANVMTPGYARREVALSPQSLGGNFGGVRVDGIIRHVNAGLLAEARGAAAAKSDASTRVAHLRQMEQVIGLPGEAHGLETALSRFQAALSSAAARPDDELRLTELAHGASALAGRLNAASNTVQAARTEAEQAISNEVALINSSLERVVYLNRRIAATQAEGHDSSSLQDERQVVIDRIATILPLQQVLREGGAVALFTREGAVLLDGTSPSRLGFSPVGQVQPEQALGAGLASLIFNGQEIAPDQLRLFAGGSLGAHFDIRDRLAPRLQDDLDALAVDLHARLSDPQVDPSLAPGQSGIFIDRGQPSGPVVPLGLSARLAVNAAVDPSVDGEPWRLRAGIAASGPEPASKSSVLFALVEAMNAPEPPRTGSTFTGTASLAARFATVGARTVSARVEGEGGLAVTSARHSLLQSRQMADGVDSDAEMQRLLQYEQAYAANARVIQAIDEMLNYLLRM